MLNSSFAFQRFSDYKTTLIVKPPFMTVEKEIEIENYGSVGIVPGELIFRILDVSKEQVLNLSAKDEFGNVFPTAIKEGQGFVELMVEDYIPIFANSRQRIFITYTLKFDTRALLFYSFTYPLIDTTLPIKHAELIVKPSKGLHIVYAPESKCNGNECGWEFEDVKNAKVSFEVSYVPMPRLKVPASDIFWYGIISLMFVIIVIRFMIKRFSSKRSHFL